MTGKFEKRILWGFFKSINRYKYSKDKIILGNDISVKRKRLVIRAMHSNNFKGVMHS